MSASLTTGEIEQKTPGMAPELVTLPAGLRVVRRADDGVRIVHIASALVALIHRTGEADVLDGSGRWARLGPGVSVEPADDNL